jgi:hypothetical protein
MVAVDILFKYEPVGHVLCCVVYFLFVCDMGLG